MRIDEPVDFAPYASRIAMLLLATVMARATMEADPGAALTGAIIWGVALVACWKIRAPLRQSRWPTITPQWAGEAVAAIGMLVFLATLLGNGIQAALSVLLCALTGAALVIAERRAHLLLIVATCLTQVMMAAAESRSGWFVPCAAAFTFAVLTLFAFDLGETLRGRAATSMIGARKTSHGGAVVAALVMMLALPLYLYVPQPPALYLGGRSATTSHDYSDPRGPQGGDASAGSPSQRGDPGQRSASGDKGTSDAGVGRSDKRDSGKGDAGKRAPGTQPTEELSVSDVKRDAGLANVIVMYVKTSQKLYLRGNLLDRFVGDRWQRTGEAPARTTLRAGYLHLDVPDGGAHVAQQIDIVADLQAKALFASAGATQIRFPGPTLYDNGDGTFTVPQPLRSDTSYSVDATPRLIGSRYVLDAAQPDARYLQIDPAISARVRELAESVTANAGDAWQKALALEDHLRSNYAYSYETIVPYQGRTPLDWFLFENRKGHCEFFASAMVVMLREIGIPARLANGFSLGERNPLTGYYEVRAMDGHAWAEGWIAGRGWVMFEPTPFYPLPQQQDAPPQQVADETDRYLERLADTSAQLSPQALRTELLQIARDTWSSARHLQLVLTRWAMRVLPWLPLAAALLALGWMSWIVARLAWRDTRERREVARLLDRAQADQGGAVLSLAQALELTYGSRGCTRSAQRTLRQYCELLVAQAVPLPADFADAFDAARYGGGTPAYTAHAGQVASTIRARVAAQRYPRLQELLQQWREKLLRRMRA